MPSQRFFKKKCYVVIVYAPPGTCMSDADIDFNEFITDRSKGMVLFHDHFVGRAGGFAIFYVDSERELESLQDKKQLKDWEFQIFPLTFTELPIEFLYQIDFTLGTYRGKRLGDLYALYAGSEYAKNVDSHMGASTGTGD